MRPISRRTMLRTGLGAAVGAIGAGALARVAIRRGLVAPDCGTLYGAGEFLNYAAQRVLTPHGMAREFDRGMISRTPFMNEVAPVGDAFKAQQAKGFSDWKLVVNGMVARPTSFSVPDLRALATRSQITEVACEEGWSYVAEWIGTPLYEVLHEVGPLPQARYVAYFTGNKGIWDSLDMAEAMHPQTLMTWGMNDGDLPVGFGGPLRLRVPRQIGGKSLKYVTQLTVTDSLKKLKDGMGASGVAYGYAWWEGV